MKLKLCSHLDKIDGIYRRNNDDFYRKEIKRNLREVKYTENQEIENSITVSNHQLNSL
jgi:hypothetical protein